MLLTLQLKLKIKKKGHTPSITTVTITVYLEENGNKKKNFLERDQNAAETKIQNVININKKLQKVDKTIISHYLLSLNFM